MILNKRIKQIVVTLFLFLNLICFGQELDKILYRGWNPYEGCLHHVNEGKMEVNCVIQAFLNKNGCQYKLDSMCHIFTETSSIIDVMERVSYFSNFRYIESYKNELWPHVKKAVKYDFNDINLVSGLGLFDSVNIFFEKMRRARPSVYGHVYAKRTNNPRDYLVTMRNLMDLDNSNEYNYYFNTAINSLEDPLSFNKLYTLAKEVIYINNQKLNKLFWKSFSCEREIPVIFMETLDWPDTYDTAMVSMAYIFGRALAHYHGDPLLYNLIENQYSVATVNEKPFDPKFYDNYKEIVEKYIYHVSGEKVNIPFFIRFPKKPINGYEYIHYPIRQEYYSVPDTTTGYSVEDFPKNYCISFLKD